MRTFSLSQMSNAEHAQALPWRENTLLRTIFLGTALLMAVSTIHAQVSSPMEDVNKVVDLTLDSLGKAETARSRHKP